MRICVYCGSNNGNKTEYIDAAERLGKSLAKNGIGLVYGGGNAGMMGKISSAVIESAGEVIGVIPKTLLKREIPGPELSEVHVVNNIHERKALMMELSDGFVAMPGGLGTFEEIFEVINWAQLKIHNKPYGFLNTRNYFGKMFDLLDHIAGEGFLNIDHKNTILIDETPENLIIKIAQQINPAENQGVVRVPN
jgi:uncharacterized protein (TIGR00730 family)